MPKYEPSDEEMEEYGASKATPDSEEKETEPGSVDEENADTAEILVSKSDLPSGCKVGDRYTVRVVADYGDEKGLELVKESESKETTEEPMSTAARELTALSDEGE